MPRGGHRENAGRKTTWVHAETQVIRVPKIFAPQLIQIAKSLDRGESLELVTQSKKTGESDLCATGKESSDQLSLLDHTDQIENASYTVSSTTNLPSPLSGRALSRRLLNYGKTTINRKRSESGFTEWTRKEDPEGLGWVYSDLDKLYHPVV
jgi:hypothetical protein